MNDNQSDIWRLQAQYDTQGLIKILASSSPDQRKRAAAALRALGARDAIPALRRAFSKEQDPDAKASFAAALEALEGDANDSELEAANQPSVEHALISRLVKQLDSRDPQEVIDAARQLGELGEKIAVEPLVTLFKDARVSIQVRLAVAEALLKLESAPVEVALLANLRHADWHIRRNGAAILGQLKAEWAIEPLARALRDPHPIVRRTARAALRHIGTPEARRVLVQQDNAASRDSRPAASNEGPVAPTTGLLRHVQRRDNPASGGQPDDPEVEDGEATSAGRQIHAGPTRPLDPKVLDELEERRRKKNQPPKDQDPPDEAD